MAAQKQKIALFIGNDVTSHLILNKIVPEMLDCDFQPVIFMVKHPTSKKAQLKELLELAFFERTVTNDIIYPMLDDKAYRNGHPLSPKQLAEVHKLKMFEVDDVNAGTFLGRQKRAKGYKGAINIRGFQKFEKPIIDLFQKNGFFLNLHPGLLPEYRGVMSIYREMADKTKTSGWTLHHVDENWDTGAIVSSHPHKRKRGETGLMATIDLASTGAKAIINAVQYLQEENVIAAFPQAEQDAKYYSYPTQQELRDWKKSGVTLCNPSEMPQKLTEIFIDTSTQLGREVRRKIESEYKEWKSQPKSTSQSSGNTNNPPFSALAARHG